MKVSAMLKVVAMVICVAAVSAAFMGVAFADDGARDVLDKQAEIDKYLFEDHADDIAALGITVTHTAPIDTYVEIGITPYTEESAEYLYGIFGRDMVKVVKGEQAVTLEYGNGAADSGPAYAEEDAQTTMFPWLAAVLAVAAVAAGATVVILKRKSAR